MACNTGILQHWNKIGIQICHLFKRKLPTESKHRYHIEIITFTHSLFYKWIIHFFIRWYCYRTTRLSFISQCRNIFRSQPKEKNKFNQHFKTKTKFEEISHKIHLIDYFLKWLCETDETAIDRFRISSRDSTVAGHCRSIKQPLECCLMTLFQTFQKCFHLVMQR